MENMLEVLGFAYSVVGIYIFAIAILVLIILFLLVILLIVKIVRGFLGYRY